MTALLSFSIRRTSVKWGRSAMLAISSANSYHLRPHCTKRAASAMTCSRAASDGPLLSYVEPDRAAPELAADAAVGFAVDAAAAFAVDAAAGFAALPEAAGLAGTLAAAFPA